MIGKFVVIDTLNNFKSKLSSIPSSAIVLIKDVGQIYAHGTYFGAQKTYELLNLEAAGLAPAGGINANGLISNVESEWVLTVTNGKNPVWKKLPANAFSNDSFELKAATTTDLGGIKVGSVYNGLFSTLTGKHYAVNVDNAGLAYVSVPWDFTDLNVKQTSTSLLNEDFSLLFSHTADDSTHTEGTRKASNLKFNPSTGTLTTTILKGNLDGSYINKLTGYSKASTKGSISTNDSLNTALGKLEHKADVVYDLVDASKPDSTTIDTLREVLNVLSGITDTLTIQGILGNYVTLAGTETITGKKTFTLVLTVGSEGGTSLVLSSNKGYTNLCFNSVVNSLNNSGYLSYKGDMNYYVTNSGWSKEGKILHSENTYIKDGSVNINGASITPVDITSELTINGLKTFLGILTIKHPEFGKNTKIYNYANKNTDNVITVIQGSNWTHGIYLYDSYRTANNSGLLYAMILGGYTTDAYLKLISYNCDDSTMTATEKAHTVISTGASSFASSVTSSKFVTRNGTSSQFVKGDGSLDSNSYVTTSGSLKNPNAIKFKNTSNSVVTYDGSSPIDLSTGIYYALNSTILTPKHSVSGNDYNTPKAVKDRLVELFANVGLGVGSVTNVPYEAVTNWNDENKVIGPYATYSFIKLSGGYSGSTHGLWLVSAFGDKNLYYVGRYSDNWTSLRKIATDEDLNDYLPKAGGGTLTTSNGYAITINSSMTTGSYSRFHVNNVEKATVGYYSGLAYISNESNSSRIGVKDDGTPVYRTSQLATKESTLWHSGNDGSGSGLDADTLDSLHASSFFKLSDGGLISNSSDLNTYTTVGTYSCVSDSSAQSLANCPVDHAFRLVVSKPLNGADYILQELTVYWGSHEYTRVKYNTGLWSAWEQRSTDLAVYKAPSATVADKATTADIASLLKGDWGNPTIAVLSALMYSIVPKTDVGSLPANSNANGLLTINTHSGNYYHQLALSSDGNLYHRNFINEALNNTKEWKQIAFTDSTVESANKLSNTVYLWGQAFDGTQNLNGNIRMGTGGGGIGYKSQPNTWTYFPIYLHNEADNKVLFRAGLTGTGDTLSYFFAGPTQSTFVISNNSDVGIGTSSPTSKLHVVGSGYFSNSLSTNGDFSLNGVIKDSKNYIKFSGSAEEYKLTQSSKYSYVISGTTIQIINAFGSVDGSNLISIDCGTANSTTNSIYFGAVNSGLSNNAANFVIGRRTGAQTWAESLRINTSGNVTIGNSDKAGSDYKLCVDGLTYTKALTSEGNILPKLDKTYYLGNGNYRWKMVSSKIDINETYTNHTTPPSLPLCITVVKLNSDVVSAKQAPGIGFHIQNSSWASLIYYSGQFHFIDADFENYVFVKAQSFVKNGSSNENVLLGGGNDKALSDFAMAADYLPLTGGSLSGPLGVIVNDSDNIFTLKSNSGTIKLINTASGNYIESGNKDFTGNVALNITGYNGNKGSNLYLNFTNTSISGSVSVTGAINPAASLTHNLGTSSLRWNCLNAGYANLTSTLDWLLTLKNTASSGNAHIAYVNAKGNTWTSGINSINNFLFVYNNETTKAIGFNTEGLITCNGFNKRDSSDSYVLLGGGGHMLISDIVVDTTTLEFEKELTVGADWVDTGIQWTSEYEKGSYVVQVSFADYYYFTGLMTINPGAPSHERADEIILHGGGFDWSLNNALYLRTYNDATNRIYKLLIARHTTTGKRVYKFKLKKLI